MRILYFIIQCTWGCLQTLLGGFVFIFHMRDRHFRYKGAYVTVWKAKSSLSLGLFVFVTNEPYFYDKLKNDYGIDEIKKRLLVHEYGHTVQSLMLGPLYLPLMGIPSTVWGFLPYFNRLRKEQGVSYFSFFTEKWANRLGESVTGEASPGQVLID